MIRNALVCGCVILIPVLDSLSAMAQPLRPEPALTVTRPSTVLQPVASALRPSIVAVRLYGIDAPREVAVDGPFAVTAEVNVEAASLPLETTWDFGDGSIARGLSARHAYRAPGHYSVLVRVANEAGEEIRHLRIRAIRSEAAPSDGPSDHDSGPSPWRKPAHSH
jgi:hypothetical protein